MDLTKKRRIDESGVFDANYVGVLTPDDARKIVESLTQDNLLGIIQNALLRHPDVLDAVRSFADRDITQRKLFIRGLGWETTTEKLRTIFTRYGELDEAIVILDKVTGKSKGYGFVTFKHIDGAIMALKDPSKKIDGRMTVTQLAAAGVSGSGGAGVGIVGGVNPVDVSLRKIYVANVPYDMPSERLLHHFSMYGQIEEGPLGFDKATGKSKGFALFVYKTAEAARASLVDPMKTIEGHQLNCKLAIDGKRGKPPGVATGPIGAVGGSQGNGDATGTTMANGPAVGISGPYGVYADGLGTVPGGGAGGSGLLSSRGVTSGLNLSLSSGFSSGIGGPYGGGSNFRGSGSAAYGMLGGVTSGPAGGLGSLTALGGSAIGGYAVVGPTAGGATGGTGIGGGGRVPSLYGFGISSGVTPSGDKMSPYGLPNGEAPPGQPAPRILPGSAFQGCTRTTEAT